MYPQISSLQPALLQNVCSIYSKVNTTALASPGYIRTMMSFCVSMYTFLFIKVKVFVNDRCAGEFDASLLEDTVVSLQDVVLGWLRQVYGEFKQLERFVFLYIDFETVQ